MAVLEARGIDSSSLLGFLATIGGFCLLCEKWPNSCLSFDRITNHAIFEAKDAPDDKAIVTAIATSVFLPAQEDELKLLGASEYPKQLTCSAIEKLTKDCLQVKKKIAYLSGLVCDNDLLSEKSKADAGATTLCASNGAGHQKMFTTMRDLHNLIVDDKESVIAAPTKLVTEDHIRRALREPWSFKDVVPDDARSWMRDRKPTLRWDEGAERLHALRFADPNADPEPFRTELGAYALATHSFSCLPVVPSRRGPLTVSSTAADNGAIDFSWPLWWPPIRLQAVKMLIWSAESSLDSDSAKQRGVFRLMRARRLTQDKGKLTFLPAVHVW